eukprot:TRINITY_DN841_c0_g1_i3.p2 TRINITY_DN841_c0_g1~~TRINITY_DN841_c0_g1_i3.p2  ORF type:complete len:129 (-),score=37.83 TRINITY_DN841_c0_g1_i3:752-1105(-)
MYDPLSYEHTWVLNQQHLYEQQQQQQQEAYEQQQEAYEQQQQQKAQRLEVWGNPDTMNLQQILLVNIQASDYFKSLYALKTYHEVVDEIYNTVDHLGLYIALQTRTLGSWRWSLSNK